MAGRLRRTVTAMTLVALLLPLAAATSLAAKPIEVFSFSENGYTAQANEGVCTADGDIETCTSAGVFLFSGNRRAEGSGAIRGTEVCYFTRTDVGRRDGNQVIGEVLRTRESGCTSDVGDGTGFEPDLSSATIAPTAITLEIITCHDFECAPTGERDITVEGTFTATSAAARTSFHEGDLNDGVCTIRVSSQGTRRAAVFSGTVDGQPLDLGAPDGDGLVNHILRGSDTSIYTCPSEA